MRNKKPLSQNFENEWTFWPDQGGTLVQSPHTKEVLEPQGRPEPFCVEFTFAQCHIGSRPLAIPQRISGIDNQWMDGWIDKKLTVKARLSQSLVYPWKHEVLFPIVRKRWIIFITWSRLLSSYSNSVSHNGGVVDSGPHYQTVLWTGSLPHLNFPCYRL